MGWIGLDGLGWMGFESCARCREASRQQKESGISATLKSLRSESGPSHVTVFRANTPVACCRGRQQHSFPGRFAKGGTCSASTHCAAVIRPQCTYHTFPCPGRTAYERLGSQRARQAPRRVGGALSSGDGFGEARATPLAQGILSNSKATPRKVHRQYCSQPHSPMTT